MRDQGAPARTADGEDLDDWTNERVARQRALRAAVLIDAIRCLVGAGGTRVPAGSLACAPDCSAIITVPHCARTVTPPCTADAQCPGDGCTANRNDIAGCCRCDCTLSPTVTTTTSTSSSTSSTGATSSTSRRCRPSAPPARPAPATTGTAARWTRARAPAGAATTRS